MVGGANEIGGVRGKGRVLEFALACADAGEVESEDSDTLCRQRGRNSFRRQHVLPAGKAMRKQRIGARLPIGNIERGGELVTAFALELESFGRHSSPPCRGDIDLTPNP